MNSSKPYQSGNAWEDCAEYDGVKNGWFVGSQDWMPSAGLCNSEVLEIRWCKHFAGQVSGVKPLSTGRTLSILVSGEFQIVVAGERHTLRQPGDYVIWGSKLQHSWVALEDSVCCTVRWKEEK